MSTETLRIGVVGLDQNGLTHAEAIARQGHEVSGADVDEEARDQFTDQFDGEVYEEPRDLYESDVDGVVITMPNRYHDTLTQQAFDMGVDVYLEKPLAHTLESAERIVEAERECDQFCMVGFSDCSVRSAEVLEEYVEEGWFGDVSHIEAVSERRRGIPGRGTWFTSREYAGGGVVTDLGSEVINLVVNRWTNSSVERVWGCTWSDFGDRDDYSYLTMFGTDGDSDLFDVEDAGVALLQFADGTTASIRTAWATNGNRRMEYRLTGTDGGAFLDLTESSGGYRNDAGVYKEGPRPPKEELRLYETRDTGTPHHVDSIVTVNSVDKFVAQMGVFAECLSEGAKPEFNTASEGLEVQRVIDAIYRSATTGEPVTLDA